VDRNSAPVKRNSNDKRTMSELMNEVFLEQTEEVAKAVAFAIKDGRYVESKIKTERIKALPDLKENFTKPLIEKFEALPSVVDSLCRTYSPAYLEPIIRLEAMSFSDPTVSAVRLFQGMMRARPSGQVGINARKYIR
jgi:hypothetical protein